MPIINRFGRAGNNCDAVNRSYGLPAPSRSRSGVLSLSIVRYTRPELTECYKKPYDTFLLFGCRDRSYTSCSCRDRADADLKVHA